MVQGAGDRQSRAANRRDQRVLARELRVPGNTAGEITGTEAGYLAGVVAGTLTALKALVVDANKRINELCIGTLSLGAGAGTAVTSSAAELNILTGVTATAAEINLNDGSVAGTVVASKTVVVDANKDVGNFRDVTVRQVINTGDVGTRNGTYTSAVAEYGDGAFHKTVLTLAAANFTLTDDGGVGQYGSFDLYTFPAGNIVVLGATLNGAIQLDGLFIATAEGDIGIGTAAVTDGNALAGTEVNVVPSTSFGPLVGQAGTCDAISTGGATFDGTSSAVVLRVNVRVDDDASHTTAPSNNISGTVTVLWANAGDV